MLKKTFFLSAVLLSALSGQAQAVTLNADGQWHAFDVDGSVSKSGGLEWIDMDGNALSFEFTLSSSAILKVVDGGFAGDRFQVFDKINIPSGSIDWVYGNMHLGNLQGITSSATNTYPISVGTDFDAAYADSSYSRGVFLLGPGSYSITGLLSQSALDDANSAINATVGAVSLTAVPLPAAAWLYVTGASLLGLVSRRRKSN